MRPPHSPRVVVITGASAGIGRAVARRFATRNIKIALLARGDAGLEAVAADVRAAGSTALPIAVDTADPAAVRAAADQVERELGVMDCWINNAFTSVFAPFTDVEPEEFRRVTEVTYLGYVNGTRAALHYMRPRRWGTIVQVGSALAYRGVPLQTAYCGAKHAIQGFTESLRCELRHDRAGVKLTMVQLPAVNTPQFDWVLSRLPKRAQPIPPIYQPELAAKAIVFAAGHPSRREHWVGASTVATLIANRFAPAFMDWYLSRAGYRDQQTRDPRDPDRPSNLWRPVDAHADRGAHGSFDDRSRATSVQMWLSHHRDSILATTAAAGAAVLGRKLRHR